jgi:hypothetical protein
MENKPVQYSFWSFKGITLRTPEGLSLEDWIKLRGVVEILKP